MTIEEANAILADTGYKMFAVTDSELYMYYSIIGGKKAIVSGFSPDDALTGLIMHHNEKAQARELKLREVYKEFNRFIDYCNEKRARTFQFQNFAAKRMSGEISKEEAMERLEEIDRQPIVYNLEDLETAVHKLLKIDDARDV